MWNCGVNNDTLRIQNDVFLQEFLLVLFIFKELMGNKINLRRAVILAPELLNQFQVDVATLLG